MKENIKTVVYQSIWKEGVVETMAKLNLRTGKVFDIEVSDDEESPYYGIHDKDIIFTPDYEEVNVEPDLNGVEYAIDIQDLYLFS